ncbi:MAG: stage II sporulation protein M [Bacillota bacterium]|jgi:stage II sporulation protein M
MAWGLSREEQWDIQLGEGVILTLGIVTLLVMGVVAGALAVNHLEAGQRQELYALVDNFVYGMAHEPWKLNPSGILSKSLAGSLKTAGALWLLGLTVVGIPVVCLITLVRGFLLGFTVGFLAFEMGWKGVVLSLASVFPQNLLAVPALLVLAISSVSFSLYLVRRRSSRIPLAKEFTRYSMIALACCVALVVSCVIEAYLVPPLMTWVSRLLS